VRIAYICYQKGAELEFYIYGDGDQKSMLIEMAKKLGILNKNLYFMGSITDTRVAYQSSDIFLLTSEHEGTPNVILEAMSCGLPVVSTMVGGVPQLIVDGVNGFLIDPLESEYSYANRLLELAEKSAVRKKMGIIIEKYGLNNVFKKLSDLYTLITISHYKNRN
jgi:glycosyltransferase involved in cell wall biosynthesis